jgi:hypothetical protein
LRQPAAERDGWRRRRLAVGLYLGLPDGAGGLGLGAGAGNKPLGVTLAGDAAAEPKAARF